MLSISVHCRACTGAEGIVRNGKIIAGHYQAASGKARKEVFIIFKIR